jgi:MFS family permease
MSMPAFLKLFFPHVAAGTSASPWCEYSDPQLQLFTSSLFLAAMLSTLVAAWFSARGRKLTMLLAGLCFLAGVGLCAGAPVLAALICGRLLLGFGIGLANQCVPVYLSEMVRGGGRGGAEFLGGGGVAGGGGAGEGLRAASGAAARRSPPPAARPPPPPPGPQPSQAPPQIRGTLNITFQLATTFGLMLAQLVNLGTARLDPWGWRLSIALAGGRGAGAAGARAVGTGTALDRQ